MLGNGYASPSSSSVRRRRGRPSGSGSGAGGGGGRYGYWQPLALQQHEQKRQQDRNLEVPPLTEFDMAYFRAYSHVGVHEEMIKDRVRTETYRSAIMRYQHLISDKVVLDVGCGTGILAILCAFAGAKRVYAVDASEIAIQASEVVKDNNLSDRVTVLHGRVEDVNIDEKVDVIISEWMGYMLLYESMLPSIIFSRDKWLKPGGLILPSHASLFMAPVTNTDRYRESIGFWHDVYGINMSAMVPLAKQYAFEEPTIETISGENVLTWPILVKEVDCYTVTAPELESVTAKFSFSSMLQAPLHGFAFWFDVVFDGPTIQQSNYDLQPPPPECQDGLHSQGSNQNKKRAKSDESIVLSTAPEDAPTHWQQTLLYLYDPIELKQDQKIEGSITLSQSKESRRFLNLHLEYSSGGRSYVKESVMR
ncbi:probable protein arginine N-methyltransferase 6.2 isoform X1 [Zingiber officinale]|uniref:probable protein arginine N-methyltransferase 6.2 isoform X1 n=1 Tax=Zingiber officinale TaxID=94328 RepID=UPI001C4B687E|nr:probable protein arginine N-methyltransferase 6.2 isoform X1 [Zingiber officinale]